MLPRDHTMDSLEDACDICGDFGDGSLIMMCATCPARQHIYCSEHCGFVIPEIWFCEECKSEKADLRKLESTAVFSSTIGNIDQSNAQNLASQGDVKTKDPRKTLKAMKPGKVKFLSTEEVMKLSSGQIKGSASPNLMTSKKIFASKSTLRVKKSHHKVSAGHACMKVPASKAKELNDDKDVAQQPKKHAVEECQPGADYSLKEPGSSIQEPGRIMKKVPSISPPLKFSQLSPKPDEGDLVKRWKSHSFKEQPMEVSRPSVGTKALVTEKKRTVNCVPPISSPSKFSHLAHNIDEGDLFEHWKSCISREQPVEISGPSLGTKDLVAERKRTMNCVPSISSPYKLSHHVHNTGTHSWVEDSFLLHILPELDKQMPHLPALSAVWMGRFIFASGTSPEYSGDAIRAHLSSRVHPKAYELSVHMPKDIQVEAIPVCHVWTDLFQNDLPDLCDVALYFYPADAGNRYTEKYSSLVKLMVNHESALRSFIDGAELLIFTSKLLHEYSHVCRHIP